MKFSIVDFEFKVVLTRQTRMSAKLQKPFFAVALSFATVTVSNF